jgi:hypothetical protein
MTRSKQSCRTTTTDVVAKPERATFEELEAFCAHHGVRIFRPRVRAFRGIDDAITAIEAEIRRESGVYQGLA